MRPIVLHSKYYIAKALFFLLSVTEFHLKETIKQIGNRARKLSIKKENTRKPQQETSCMVKAGRDLSTLAWPKESTKPFAVLRMCLNSMEI